MARRNLPAHSESQLGLLARVLRSRSPEGYFALMLAGLDLAATPLDLLLRKGEQRLYEAAGAPRRPVVFVAGAPRSGTTVVSQTLLRHLPVAYVNNLSAVFSRSPIMADRIFRNRPRNARVQPRSFYGKTLRFWGPHDGLHLWDRWFGSDRTVVPTALSEEAVRGMQGYFGALERAHDRPVLNKNNSLNLSAHLVAEALETAHFVIMKRDPLYLAQALLLARKAIHGDRRIPYGIPAPTGDAPPPAGPLEEVARQALFHNEMARVQQERLGPERVRVVAYEDFCRDPVEVVAGVASLLGQDVDRESLGGILKPFTPSMSQKLGDAEFREIEELVGQGRASQ